MEYRDFNYVMSDMSKVYLGAKQTYEEACNHDYMPFKLRAVIEHYFKNASSDMTIEEHMRSLSEDSLDYMTLKALHAKIKISIYTQITDKKGNTAGKWLVDQILTVDQYVSEESYHLYPEHALVTELIISKLHLMAFSL